MFQQAHLDELITLNGEGEGGFLSENLHDVVFFLELWEDNSVMYKVG
jgi:hypothetical protein